MNQKSPSWRVVTGTRPPAGRKPNAAYPSSPRKAKASFEQITGAREMVLGEFEHQARPKPSQGVLTAVQRTQFPPFDIGLDEIEAIEPEHRDDGVEGGQGDKLLRDRVPAVPRRPEVGQAEAKAAATFDRQGQRAEPGIRAERHWGNRDIGPPCAPTSNTPEAGARAA
jgi:hypothetical protein